VLRRLEADDRLGLEALVGPPRAEFAHAGHVEQLGRGGVDPGAVDVELPGVFHSGSPFRSGRDASLGKDGTAWHHALSLYTHGYGGDGSPGTLRLPESAIPAKPEGTHEQGHARGQPRPLPRQVRGRPAGLAQGGPDAAAWRGAL